MKTILLVDDEKEFLLFFGKELERRGFRVIAAVDGRSALKMVEQERPDLVILDVMLPDIDGATVSKEIRSKETVKDVPIIFVSGLFTRQDAMEKDHLVNGNIFVPKPFSIKEILTEINGILGGGEEYEGSEQEGDQTG